MGTVGKVSASVKRIPSAVWICATIIIVMEIIAVAINIDLNRPTDQLLSFIATINGVLVTAVTLLSRQESGNNDIASVLQGVDALRNGELDKKLQSSLEEHLPTLVGAILDARGVPVNEAIVPPTAVVASGHDQPPTTPTQPTQSG